MRAVILIIPALLMGGCMPIFSDCADTVAATAQSPDGEFVASVVMRDCGATTTEATSVFIKSTKPAPQNADGRGEPVFVFQGDHAVGIEWQDGALTISAYVARDDVFLKKPAWNKLNILYR